jgi:hypothetical protein
MYHVVIKKMHLKQGMLFQNPKKEQINKVNKSFRGINGVSWGFKINTNNYEKSYFSSNDCSNRI